MQLQQEIPMESYLRTILKALMVISLFLAIGQGYKPIIAYEVQFINLFKFLALPVEPEVGSKMSCLPASCQSFGCCSGDCDYWCTNLVNQSYQLWETEL